MQVRQHLVLSTYEARSLEDFIDDAIDFIKFSFHTLDLLSEVLVQLRILPTTKQLMSFDIKVTYTVSGMCSFLVVSCNALIAVFVRAISSS